MKRRKERFNFLSFNDLLLKTREHLLENSFDIDEVLVDEYQDTNTCAKFSNRYSKSPHLYFGVGNYDPGVFNRPFKLGGKLLGKFIWLNHFNQRKELLRKELALRKVIFNFLTKKIIPVPKGGNPN